MRPKKALVLGGTGHIGNALVRALLERGGHVTVCCHQAGARPNLADLDVEVLVGDDRAPGQLAHWIDGHELVIDAAAPYPLRLFDPDVNHRQNLEDALRRCRTLIQGVKAHDAELVYISSFTTLRGQTSLLARLQSGVIQGSHPYFETKISIERDVINAAREGLKAVVINPSVCLGPWDLKQRDTCFVAAVARGDLMGTTGQMLNVIDVRDVADATLKALETQHYGQPLGLSGHNIDLDTLVRHICDLAGCKPPIMRGSTRLMAMGSYWIDAVCGSLGRASPFPSLPILLLCECHEMSPSKEQRKLGLIPRSLETTLDDALSWYRRIDYC